MISQNYDRPPTGETTSVPERNLKRRLCEESLIPENILTVGYLEINYGEQSEYSLVRQAAALLTETLFIQLLFPPPISYLHIPLNDLLGFVKDIYQLAMEVNLTLNTVVLFPFSEDVVTLENNLKVVFQNQNLDKNIKNHPLRYIPLRHPVDPPKIKLNIQNGVGIPQYPLTSLGGTFDRLHAGHKLLLTAGVLCSSHKLVIGLADGPLLSKKVHLDMVETYFFRRDKVLDFLNVLNPLLEYTVVPLVNVGGPALAEVEMKALVVSLETVVGADWINDERKKLNFPPLQVIVVDLIANHPDLEKDACDKISSSQLRKYEWKKQQNKSQL